MAQVFRDAGGLVGGAVDMRTTGSGDACLAMAELGTPDVDITVVVDVGQVATQCATSGGSTGHQGRGLSRDGS